MSYLAKGNGTLVFKTSVGVDDIKKLETVFYDIITDPKNPNWVDVSYHQNYDEGKLSGFLESLPCQAGNIDFSGEDGSIWRFRMKGGKWTEESGKIVYDEGTETDGLYVVCIDPAYVRDTQVFNDNDLSAFDAEDYYELCSHEAWTDADREPVYIGVFRAGSGEEAVKMGAEHSGYEEAVLTAQLAETGCRGKLKRLEIPVSGNTRLVAEVVPGDVYKEIFIGLDKNGSWWQDLALARPKYHHENGGVITEPEKYEVLVWGDGNDEDWSARFEIDEYKEEESQLLPTKAGSL